MMKTLAAYEKGALYERQIFRIGWSEGRVRGFLNAAPCANREWTPRFHANDLENFQMFASR
jgi:hypothetical protein